MRVQETNTETEVAEVTLKSHKSTNSYKCDLIYDIHLPTMSKAVVVAISGCSSSGKTTLSRLLRDIFPNAFVLHEDDFYRPEAE